MRKNPWMILSTVVAAALPWAACGGSNSGNTTTGTPGTGGHKTTSHTTSSSLTTGSGGADCTMILQSDPCDDCISAHCCTQLNDCNGDGTCLDCFTGNAMDPTACTMGATKTTLDAITACFKASCTAACAPTPPSCNPITNAGCASGSACDFSADMNMQQTFDCYPPPPPNTAAICASCDDKATACVGGSTCLIPTGSTMGTCAKFCCANGDCGTGVCQPTGSFNVGVCVTAASVDAGMIAPACDALAVSPSQGTCVNDGGAPPPDAGPG
jgi:hypothetical protein